jgi:hypothetical protein
MRTPILKVTNAKRALCAVGICALILATLVGSVVVTVAISPAAAQTPQGSGGPQQPGGSKQNQSLATPQASPAPTPPKLKVCKECQYLADDIDFIQGRIDQLLRSQASMRKYANLQDPNVQQALKDDDAKVASLRTLLAAQQAKLAKCVEDKCKPPPPASGTVPVTPGTVPVTPSTPQTPQTTGGVTLPWYPWGTPDGGRPLSPILRKAEDTNSYGHKVKPVEYVKICSLYGSGFYYTPSKDTCIKIGRWQYWNAHYDLDGGNPSGCGFRCGGPSLVQPFNFFSPPSDKPDTWRTFDVLEAIRTDQKAQDWILRNRAKDDLLKLQYERGNFLKNYWALPSDARSYINPLSTLGIMNRQEADIRGQLHDFEPRIDTAATANQAPAPEALPAPKSDNSGSAGNPPSGDNAAPPPASGQPAPPPTSDKPPASGDSTPATQTTGQQTTTSDGGGTGDTQYVTMVAKVIHSTLPGIVGDPEPGAQLALGGPKYPLRKEGDAEPGPPDGHNKNRPFCITISDGTCEMQIELSDKAYYGLARVNLSRIHLDFETMNYRGGFDIVGRDSPAKIDTTTDGGNTEDFPSSFNIGTMIVVRHIFKTPYDGSDGYPKNIKFTVDSCLFILPAPWGWEPSSPVPAHSDLPAATIELAASTGVAR